MTSANLKSEAFNNVSTTDPCPICGKPDYCSITADKQIVCCRRYTGHPGGEQRYDKNGNPFWFYDFRDKSKTNLFFSNIARVINLPDKFLSGNNKSSPGSDSVEPLPPDQIHNVYTFILSQLTLSDIHRQNLIDRGLTEESITYNGYRSWPDKPWTIAGTAIKKFSEGICSRVPGFYVHTSKFNKKPFWNLAGQPGLLIPIRNLAGQIMCLKYRADDPGTDEKGKPLNKYRYVSHRDSLISSGSPIHVPRHDREAINYSTVRITEGELKADIATQFTGVLTLSIPGVNNWIAIIDLLKDICPDNVIISFDADCILVREVAEALQKMSAAIIANGFHIILERWEAWCGKGIDDVLAYCARNNIKDSATTNIIRSINNINNEALSEINSIVYEAQKNDPSDFEKMLLSVKERLKNIGELLSDTEQFSNEQFIDDLLFIRENEKIEWAKIHVELKKRGLVTQFKNILDERKQIASQVNRTYINNTQVNNNQARSTQANDLQARSTHTRSAQPLGTQTNNIIPLNKDSSHSTQNSFPNDPQNFIQAKPFKELFPNAPIADEAIIPIGWQYSDQGILWEVPLGKGFPERATSTPCVIDFRYQDVATDIIHLSLRWLQNGRWRSRIVPRSIIANTRKIIDLSDYGLDIQSSTANLVSKYLCQFEAQNMKWIPCAFATSQLGWQGANAKFGIMIGEKIL